MTQTIEQFGQTIKQKYPQYKDISDAELGQKMLTKYPQYKDMVSTSQTTTSPTEKSVTDTGVGKLPIVKQLNQFGVGLGTSIAKAGLNLGKATSKVLGGIANIGGPSKVGNFLKEKVPQGIDTIKEEVYTKPFQKELGSFPGKVGNLVGATAPYVATGGTVAGITNKVANLAPSALTRVLAGASAEAAQNTILGYALSGGNTKQAITQGVTAGILKGVTSGGGETLKSAGVDKKFMSRIYKTDKKEEGQMLFGSKGKTLHEEALDRGLTGDVKHQATQVQEGLNSAENAITKEFEKAGNPVIELNNPKRYIDAIQNRIKLLTKSGATEEATGLQTSLDALKTDKGKIAVNNALGLRRLLDNMRQNKSFLAQTEELGAQQAGLKEMSDSLRRKINDIGATSKAMKDYQFFLDAKNKLLDYAVSTNNKAAIDFFDRLIFAESIYAHTGVGLGIVGARKVALARPATTAQFVKNLPKSSKTGTIARGILSSGIANATSPKQ